MKKVITLVSIFYLLIISSFAKEVNLTQAKQVAKNFYISRLSAPNTLDVNNLQLSEAFTCSNLSSNSSALSHEQNLYYIININANNGFVIISAEDIVSPVLGYSTIGTYDGNNLPPAFQKWMENYKQQIIYAIENNMEATTEITSNWNNLLYADKNSHLKNKEAMIVNPLCGANWDQQPYVNEMCPYDALNTTNQHCVTGCPATAMAIIMKYWNYPTTGDGFHSYNHPSYGTLSANFGATTYNWAAMPNNVTASNTEISKLMFNCGVSVDMQYSANLSAGYVIMNSPTPTACCEYAYKTYFGYDPATIQGLQRENYSNVDWINLLKGELSASRPIQYAGFGTGGGHTFVCDGFDANDLFHMNWGWGGYYNGFFAIDALNPGGIGTGGGTGGFNAGQQAVIGIKPLSQTGVASISMYSSITINPNPIAFYQPFTVNADIVNSGNAAFSGDFAAAVFTSTGDFVDYVEIISTGGSPLQPGYHYTGGLTFSNSGMLSVPGNYSIGIYYRETGGNWSLASASTFVNPVNVTISSPVDYLQLYSTITATPTTFIQGQPASVTVNFKNDNTATYYGQYEANLYDLSGNFVQNIGTYTESNGLPPGYYYTAPYITFSTSSITAEPGTYILGILELENGFTDWYLVGGTYYSNPINIDVVAPVMLADPYESNNTEATPYVLPLNWSNNNAHPLTTGSNFHITTDVDYYIANLPDGYTYSINARVHDSYNSGNGNIYTVDALWSYNEGSVWSLAYDDVMQGNILINGPGTLTIKVAPYFIGQVGTYLLDLNINRSPDAGISLLNDRNAVFSLFPNPASNYLNIKFADQMTAQSIKIHNNIGQVIAEFKPSQSQIQIDLSDFSAGMYYIEAVVNNELYSKKFIINK